jgi:hypothetical protein
MEHTMLKRANDFTTPKLLRDPAEIVIPRLADDPKYAAATALLSSFTDRLDWLRREKDRVDLITISAEGKSTRSRRRTARCGLAWRF